MDTMRPQQRQLIEAAEKLGVTVEVLDDAWALEGIRLSYQGQQKIILKGAIYQSINRVMEIITDNKQAAKALLTEFNIPCPSSLVFSRTNPNPKALEDFLQSRPADANWVCKPIDGTHGNAVRLNIKNTQEILEHLEDSPKKYQEWLLEEQVEGEDIRIQTIGGKLVAACRREPAKVIGDGISTIEQLAAARHELIQKQNPVNHLDIDHHTIQLLEEQGLTPRDVPLQGQVVKLKRVANMSQGAHAIDITDELHPGYFEWAERISKALSMEIFAIDAMSKNHTLDPQEHAHVLEVNARPHWLQHTFSERKQHNIAEMIIKNICGVDE